jgi:hypothetical protein
MLVSKVRDRLSVSKRAAQNFDMERFNAKKLNDVKSRIRLKSHTGLQLCKTWMMMMMMMMMWTSLGLGRVYESFNQR